MTNSFVDLGFGMIPAKSVSYGYCVKEIKGRAINVNHDGRNIIDEISMSKPRADICLPDWSSARFVSCRWR